jgi:hypothetical protein
MKMFQAMIRLGGGSQWVEREVIAINATQAKELLEMEFGEGNVMHFPREIR